jgi:fatty-acyl-CoA synthase
MSDRLVVATRRLRELGILDPRRAVAAVRTTPWLLGRGPSLALAAQIHAHAHPDKTAVVDRHGQLTWQELDGRVNQVVRALRGAGMASDDAVATVLRNGRELAEIILASQRAGMRAMPLNTWASRDELGALLDRARPRVLVYDTRHTDQLEDAVPAGTRLLTVGADDDARPDAYAYESALDRHGTSPPPPFQRPSHGGRVVIHTSGTTGTPKAAERDLSSSGPALLVGLLERVPYRHDDTTVCPAPLFHSFGLLTLSTAIASGATIVLPDSFDPEETLAAVDDTGATALSLVPIMLKRIVDLPDERRADHDVSSLRIVLLSGSALGEELRRAAVDVFGEVLYDLYGSTEAGIVTIATPEDMRDRPESVGRPLVGVDVAIVNDDGRPVPTGETGRVTVRSSMRFEGYVSGEDVPEEQGYLDTGDLGHLDEDGTLVVVGRADDMAVVGGENVYPAEVEAVLTELDGVHDVAVFGVADDEYGEVLAAFVVGDVTEEEVREACRGALASFKVPRHIAVIDELPRTATGKVLRRELRDRLG